MKCIKTFGQVPSLRQGLKKIDEPPKGTYQLS